jgi:sulfate adenylyltransferase large subunit
VAVILVDARQGVIEQTRRHSYIVSMLDVPHVVYTVNKMDLVDYAEERFDEIVRELAELGAQLGVHDTTMIPISALKGDNVVDRSVSDGPPAMPWYTGPTLLEHLESIELAADRNEEDRRFPVQWVVRPMADEHHDYRGYAGQVAGGDWRVGDEVVVLPSGARSKVAAIDGAEDDAVPGQSVTILLEHDVDVSRGDLLADPENAPVVARELTARVAWMSEKPVENRARLLVKHTTRTVTARLEEVVSVVDIATLEDRPSPGKLELNDLGVAKFRLAEPLAVDPYSRNRATGAFILIDEATNETVGAGMVIDAA